MFCNQCQQTQSGRGCTEIGVCGKDPDMQSLQEILLYGVKGMAAYANHARRLGKTDESVSEFIEEALFATVTNVNRSALVPGIGIERVDKFKGFLQFWCVRSL